MAELPFVLTAEQTCSACPEQWEGDLVAGLRFYFRYRWGVASLGVGPDEGSAVCDPHEVRTSYGHKLAGVFEDAHVRDWVFWQLLRDRLRDPSLDRLRRELIGEQT